MIKEFKNDMNLLKRAHRFAGFAVLKSLDIPSVLLEMDICQIKVILSF